MLESNYQLFNVGMWMKQVQKRLGTKKWRTRKQPSGIDFEQTIIPGHECQSWLQNPSDVSRDARKQKRKDVMETMKIANLTCHLKY
ncbi:hypothetical protein ACFX2G_033642 [Malus domestica]